VQPGSHMVAGRMRKCAELHVAARASSGHRIKLVSFRSDPSNCQSLGRPCLLVSTR
jgi:hypothetical protein